MKITTATNPSIAPSVPAHSGASVEELDEAALASVTGGGPLLDLPDGDVDAQQKLMDFVNRRP